MKGTEEISTGAYNDHFEAGTYACAGCGRPLYSSVHKFASGHGWPAFGDSLPGALVRSGRGKVEITCAGCGAHVGHVVSSASPHAPAPGRARAHPASHPAGCSGLPVAPNPLVPAQFKSSRYPKPHHERHCVNSISLTFSPSSAAADAPGSDTAAAATPPPPPRRGRLTENVSDAATIGKEVR